jgi:hypothetical protein
LADTGSKASTIGRRAAAIANRHKLAGIDPRATRRTLGTATAERDAGHA